MEHPVDWVSITSIVLSVAAIVIAIAAHRQRTKQYPRPLLVDESEIGQSYRWQVKVANRGNADAKDARLTLYSYPRRTRVPVNSWEVLKADEALVAAFNIQGHHARDFRLTLTWRQGPDFGRIRRMRIRIPRVSLRDRLWQLTVRKTPYQPSEEISINHDIGVY